MKSADLRNIRVALLAGGVVGLTLFAAGVPAYASATKCRAAIVEETAAFTRARTSALAKCWDGVAAGKGLGPCPDARADAVIAKARGKFASTIESACGGADKVCGAGTAPDESLTAIGWNLGTCANVGDGTCTNPITDCNDVISCVACVSEQAVDRAFGLYFNPAVAAVSDKSLRGCVRAIVKGSAASLIKVSDASARCWRGVNKADSGGSFSCPNAGVAGATATARAKNLARICKRCKGGNSVCGDADDVPRASIGFPASCPALGACGGPVQTAKDIADCADCVTSVLADGAVRSTIPAFASSAPPQCVPAPTPTPGG